MTATELLAPAKDAACGIAAIDCGADAVYIGAPRFGAREAAGNSLEEIARLVRHAHHYWAKVYVTVNTLLYDEEIPHALRLIAQLYDLGIDGLIIQDVGLLECDLPPLPMIASTQMHNSTPEKVAFLEQVGMQRVILARELDLEQIREIRRRTTVELECFVHGALCVCYSGQCYLSYALGGRSGNRGQCAQPCRKPYSLIDERGRTLAAEKHLLSLRDLNLSDHLADLLEAGVCSFKIEGRLKDQAYVTNVVSYYRAKLDEAQARFGLRKRSSGASRVSFTPDVRKTFNRGYTTYFLHGQGEPVGSPDTPKMVGEPVGRISAIGKRGVTVETTVPLHAGDGICWFSRQGELCGAAINGVNGNVITPAKMENLTVGAQLYRNHDHQCLAQVNACTAERRIAVSLTVRDTPDGIALLARDEDGNRAEITQPCAKMVAEKPDAALATLRKQLQKCGNTAFACADVVVELPGAYFFPVALLNALRRAVLEKLRAVRAANRPVEKGDIRKNDAPYPETTLSFHGNVLNRHAAAFYRRHGVTEIEPAAESGLDLTGRRVMTTRYCLKHQLGLCPHEPGASPPSGQLSLLDAEGHTLALRFDCQRCRMEVYLGETRCTVPMNQISGRSK